MLTIGVLDPTNGNWKDCIDAFNHQLQHTHGWQYGAGKDYTTQTQTVNGQTVAEAAAALVTAGMPDPTNFIILTGGTGPTCACITATATVPQIKVFFATAGEAGTYFTGLGSNVTGISNEQCDPTLVTQRLNHMNTYVPPLLTTAFTAFGVIGHGGPQGPQNVIDEINAVTDPNTGAPSLGLTVVQSTTPLQTAGDIPNVIQSVVSQGAQALYVCTDPLITSKAASTAINAAGMPTMHAFKKNLGGSGSNKLLYLGYELTDLFSQIADIIYNWRTTPGAPFAAPTTPTGSIKKQPSS